MNGTTSIRESAGGLPRLPNPLIGPNCLEVPITGVETKDGAFDGGYAFADYCPESRGGYDPASETCMRRRQGSRGRSSPATTSRTS